jgi:hypothetical protein
MSQVEVVTKSGKRLALIDDCKGTVEMSEEWEAMQKKARKRKLKGSLNPPEVKPTDE